MLGGNVAPYYTTAIDEGFTALSVSGPAGTRLSVVRYVVALFCATASGSSHLDTTHTVLAVGAGTNKMTALARGLQDEPLRVVGDELTLVI